MVIYLAFVSKTKTNNSSYIKLIRLKHAHDGQIILSRTVITSLPLPTQTPGYVLTSVKTYPSFKLKKYDIKVMKSANQI